MINKYIIKTIEEIDIIIEYSEELSIDILSKKPIYLDGIVFRMIQMSEHMNKIDDEFKNQHPEIDWISIKGFRNRLVHDYGGVDLNFIYKAISIDIPKLKIDLLKAINN